MTDGATPLRLLAVCQVDTIGPPEQALLQALDQLTAHGWETTVTTPGLETGGERPDGIDGSVRWEPLELGGLNHGAGARAVASWPRAWKLAREHDLVYLNGSVAGRLLPALRGRATALHVHDAVRRVPRHWLGADLVLADSRSSGVRLDPLEVHVIGSPIPLEDARSGEDVEIRALPEYTESLDALLRAAVGHHRRGSEGVARSGSRRAARTRRGASGRQESS